METKHEQVIKIINRYAANIANCTQPAAMLDTAYEIEQLYVSKPIDLEHLRQQIAEIVDEFVDDTADIKQIAVDRILEVTLGRKQ